MMNAFDVLISRLDTPQERISESEDIPTESSKIKNQREQMLKKTNRISNQQNNEKYNMCGMGIPKGEERKKETEEICKTE